MQKNISNKTWRLIVTSPNTGAWNMALDEAIFESVCNDVCLPTLRLYAWNPFCLSLGHAQGISEVDQDALDDYGWDLVRRPTGGRAILHADEITYSVCAPLEDAHIKGGVIESYRSISNCLLLALRNLGIAADSKPKNTKEKNLSKDPVCFQYPSDYEITFQGKKFIGSAQARRSEALLQHGAIPLFGDLSRIVSVLFYESEEKRENVRKKLLSRATTLMEILGHRIPWQQFAQVLIQAFEKEFEIYLNHQNVTTQEFSRAEELVVNKYANPDWTTRI